MEDKKHFILVSFSKEQKDIIDNIANGFGMPPTTFVRFIMLHPKLKRFVEGEQIGC